jgi:hypothetical protein
VVAALFLFQDVRTSGAEPMMVETVAAFSSEVPGVVGYPLVGVQRAAFSNGTRPESLPTDEAELLDEASELLSAAEVLQSRAFKLHGMSYDVAAHEMAIESLVAQQKRLLPVLECTLFEPVYQQLHMAVQAAETIQGLQRHGPAVVIETWAKVIPQTDFWAALVWVSREWKRRTGNVPKTAIGDETLVTAAKIGSYVQVGEKIVRQSLHDAGCKPFVESTGKGNPHQWRYCDALVVLQTLRSGKLASMTWLDTVAKMDALTDSSKIPAKK